MDTIVSVLVTRSRVRVVVHSIVRGVIVRVSRVSGGLRRAIATRVTAGPARPPGLASVYMGCDPVYRRPSCVCDGMGAL